MYENPFVSNANFSWLAAAWRWRRTRAVSRCPKTKGRTRSMFPAYPAEMQKNYKLFSEQVLEVPHYRPADQYTMTRPEWERYVKRMMHKPNSGINEKSGQADI